MIVTGEMMIDELSGEYASPACKLGRMVADGMIVRVRRGLYETDPRTPPYLLANHVYGPSYISFEYALAWYGIIPEKVVTVTSATCNKNRKKTFDTPLGVFTYQDIPSRAFDEGIETLEQLGRQFRMAIPEKAVCDELYKTRPTTNFEDLETLLYDDLRFDEDWVERLDRRMIAEYADMYRCTTIRTLSAYLGRFA